jgi:hypothetical protein
MPGAGRIQLASVPPNSRSGGEKRPHVRGEKKTQLRLHNGETVVELLDPLPRHASLPILPEKRAMKRLLILTALALVTVSTTGCFHWFNRGASCNSCGSGAGYADPYSGAPAQLPGPIE